MANRGRKINSESENQFIKEIFFGKKEMNKYSNVWRDWPKPYRDIYSRMFSHNIKFYPANLAKQLTKLACVINDVCEPIAETVSIETENN